MVVPVAMSPSSWPTRFLRWIGCDRSPLRRTCDRIEALVVLLAAVSYVPLAVLAAGYAGHLVYEAGMRARHATHARQVAAVVLTAAESTKPVAIWVPVRWTVDRRTHTGAVHVPSGTPAGATVPVWVDRGGHLTTPAPTTVQLADQALAMEVLTPLLLAQILALSLCALRFFLDARRFAKWDSEWWSIDSG